MNSQERRQLMVEEFRLLYGSQPDIWARAPGRVDLMGSHTDYNMGFVMTMTVDRDTWLAVQPRSDRRVVIHSLNLEGSGDFSLDDIERVPAVPWTDYVRGMALYLQEAGYELSGFDALVHSTVPFASGLSSSAAIEMAVGVAFQLASGFQVDPVQMALLGQKAENQFVGVASGILDQYSSAVGQEGCGLLLDCRNLTSRQVPMAGGIQVVICDTRAERHLAGTEYGERRAQCEEGVRLLRKFCPKISALRDLTPAQLLRYASALPEVIARRCQFIVEENQRVLDLAVALPAGDEHRLYELFAASYRGARDLYEIGAPAMAAMMEAMLAAPGVIAARQAGAGFGGCMVALVRKESVDGFARHVARDYEQRTGITPQVYPIDAAPGAGPVVFE